MNEKEASKNVARETCLEELVNSSIVKASALKRSVKQVN